MHQKSDVESEKSVWWSWCISIYIYIHVSLEETDNPNMLAETLLPVFFRCGFIDLFVSIAMAQKEKSWA